MAVVVVGVDFEGTYRPVLGLLSALKLSQGKTIITCAVEPLMPDGENPELSSAHPLTELMQYQDSLATKSLEEAMEFAAGLPNAETKHVFGSPTRVLIDVAREIDADIIATGSTGKGWLEGIFMGSVTKALAIEAHTSLLIGKHRVDTQGPLTLVVGFDGSDYARRCLSKLVEWMPGGIGRIVIGGAVEPPILQAGETGELLGETVPVEEVLSGWTEAAERVRRDLLAVCPDVVLEGHIGDTQDVLNSLMGDYDADVLVLGAAGHGFMERLILGSVSMHFVVKEGHNLLVIRA